MRRLIVTSVLIGGLLLSGPSFLYAQEKRSLKDFEIPNPFGIGLSFYNQSQPYEITSLEVQFPGFDPSLLSDFDVDNQTTSYHLRFDYWILPFLNIFGLVGDLDGRTRVNVGELDIGLPIDLGELTIDTSGTTYGVGLVLAEEVVPGVGEGLPEGASAARHRIGRDDLTEDGLQRVALERRP